MEDSKVDPGAEPGEQAAEMGERRQSTATAVSGPADRLNPRQMRFCVEYLHGDQAGNATRSYMKAYPDSSLNSAGVSATALLRDLRIQKYLAELRQQAMERVERKVESWASLVPEARRVLLGTLRGDLRSRLMLDAAREVLDRALGRPAQRLEHELLRDEERANKALQALASRTTDDGP